MLLPSETRPPAASQAPGELDAAATLSCETSTYAHLAKAPGLAETHGRWNIEHCAAEAKIEDTFEHMPEDKDHLGVPVQPHETLKLGAARSMAARNLEETAAERFHRRTLLYQ